ncbi:hypothetical protein V8E51_011891 [Hyaloscypha variabilis]
MGAALRVAPQATKNYCGGPSTWGGTAATWNTAAVNICTGEESQFCIQGSELGITVQEMAITCRNGANLAGGVIQANGNDGNIAEVAIFHS